MARFAHVILHRFSTITKELVVSLGPDTGELGLRIGMHSGPGESAQSATYSIVNRYRLN